MSDLGVRDIVVSFGTVDVLRGVSLDVAHGSLTAVVGPSGCGKTTLLRTIAGLTRARSGEIRSGTRMLTTHGIHLVPEKRRIGWVPQDAALFPHLTVAQNVAFGLGPRASRRSANQERVIDLLGLVGMSDFATRYPSQLSGGQAQRIALARALAAGPDVVLLDEPFAALDPQLRGVLRAEVRDLLQEEGMTGILVTHDQAEALSIADVVAVMRDGEIVQSGPPDEVYERPATPWVASFVGDAVLLEAVWSPGFVDCALGRIPAEWVPDEPPSPPDDTPVTVLVRPEQVSLEKGGLPGTVVEVSYTGHDALLKVALLTGARILARVSANGLLTVGSPVEVSVRGRVLAYPR